MATLEVNSLLNAMVNAAKTSLAGNLSDLKDVSVSAFKDLSQNLVNIEEMKIAGKINQDTANILVDMQKNAVQTVLTTDEGLALLAAQNAINAALDVVSGTVNKALGWTLL